MWKHAVSILSALFLGGFTLTEGEVEQQYENWRIICGITKDGLQSRIVATGEKAGADVWAILSFTQGPKGDLTGSLRTTPQLWLRDPDAGETLIPVFLERNEVSPIAVGCRRSDCISERFYPKPARIFGSKYLELALPTGKNTFERLTFETSGLEEALKDLARRNLMALACEPRV